MSDDPKPTEVLPPTKERAIAGVLVAFPVLAGLFGALPWLFLLLPIALAIIIFREPLLQLPNVRTGCIAGIVLCPIAALITMPGMPVQGFLLFAGVSAASLVAVFYGRKILQSMKPPASATPHAASPAPKAAASTGTSSERTGDDAGTGEPASTPAFDATGTVIGKPPIIATTTERETPEGTEYTVTWTDYAKLSFWDRHHMLIALPVVTVMTFSYGAAMWGDTAKLMTAAGFALAIASVGLWIYKLYHERRRHSVRAITINPDGSILLRNPPSHDANKETDGLSMVVPSGLSRLTSIEYTKTAEWHWMIAQCVSFSVEHWYDVHFLFGEEWRVSVSRNLGSRDHAHQITGHLNRLKAKLTRPQAAPAPAQSRVLD